MLDQGSSGRRRPRRPGSLKASSPVPKVATDLIVFVHGLRLLNGSPQTSGLQSRSLSLTLRAEKKKFGNQGRRGHRRPAEGCRLD